MTGSDPLTRGDSVPSAGKQPDPNGVTHSAPDSFYELVARWQICAPGLRVAIDLLKACR